MTVFFHAVLAPHFKFDAQQGDRIFMRFGGPVFGKFNEDIVEVFPKWYVVWCCIEAQCFSENTCIQLNITVHFIVQVPNRCTDDISLHISSFFIMS